MRVCLVTPAHICNNPRLVKEADALAGAGHDVRVVSLSARADFRARDLELMRGRAWALRHVEVARDRAGGRLRWLRDAVLQRLARGAWDTGLRVGRVADRAMSRHVGLLAAAAAEAPSDLIVAHNLAALPAAARAASRLRARLGFDIEDLHAGELPDEARHDAERARIRAVERRHLPRCARLTASSEGIADAIAAEYGVPRPEVVLNAFPPHEGEPEPAPGGRVRLYWYSQVIGPDRGLQEVFTALARLPARFELHLRGSMSGEWEPELRRLLGELGIGDRVHLLAPAPADALVRLASEYDIGLALEQPVSRNRELCVTNKILTYLAAGIPVAATDTDGQRRVMRRAPGAGFVYRAGDVEALAAGLAALAASPETLAGARRAAREAARATFNWALEAPRLVAYLTGSADARRAPAPALEVVA